MKNSMKLSVCALMLCFSFNTIKAQEVASLAPGDFPVAKAISDKPAAPAASSVEMTITLKNSAEHTIIIFAGNKEGIRDPKVQTYGGLSKNTLYLQSSDVICLMNTDKKPMACTSVKPGITNVEVNSSGNAITAK